MMESTPSRKKVYLIDDHPVVRDLFARVLAEEPDLEVVGQAGTATEALKGTLALQPDVVVVDLGIPDRDGIELLGALRAQLPGARLLVLSAHDDPYRVQGAFHAGAQGYLVKTMPIEDVVAGIRRVANGGTAVSAGITNILVAGFRRPNSSRDSGLASLTMRERQVLRLLASGSSTHQTASRLTISPKTVETHRVRIYGKLGCKNPAELTRIAVREKLIDA